MLHKRILLVLDPSNRAYRMLLGAKSRSRVKHGAGGQGFTDDDVQQLDKFNYMQLYDMLMQYESPHQPRNRR